MVWVSKRQTWQSNGCVSLFLHHHDKTFSASHTHAHEQNQNQPTNERTNERTYPFNSPKLGQLHVTIFKETQKIFQRIFVLDLGIDDAGGRLQFRHTDGMLVQVSKQERLRKGRFVMQPGTPIPVTTGANLVIKRTIDPVFFGAVNARQVFGHCLVIE